MIEIIPDPRPRRYRSLEDWEADVCEGGFKRSIPPFVPNTDLPQLSEEYANAPFGVAIIWSDVFEHRLAVFSRDGKPNNNNEDEEKIMGEEEAAREMPAYACNKRVHALRIEAVAQQPDGSAIITPEDEGYAPFMVPMEYMKKYNPGVGGYFIVHEDGRESWSSAKAFEESYVPVTAGSTGEASTEPEMVPGLDADPDMARPTIGG